jgi:UDP-glucose 4-epimerase
MQGLPVTPDFRGRRVLITGGAGMVGSTIADQLVKSDVAEIIVVDNLVRGRKENLEWALANGPVTLVEGDIADVDLLNSLLEGIDLVFHQAAIRITQCAEDPRLALEVLVDGTFNLLEAAVRAGVSRIVAASSASVYGQASVFPTPESHHPYSNRTFYGAAKAFNEGMLRSFAESYGLDYVALRYFNVYGPRMDVHGVYTEVIIRWIERIANGEPPIVHGDGSASLDLIYIDDVARANLLAAVAPVTDMVFNVGSGEEVSLADLARALIRAMGSECELDMRPGADSSQVARRLADTSEAERHLDFVAQVGLDEGLRRLVAWWKQEKGWTGG